MSKSEVEISGETQRYTFRLSPEVIAALDELVEGFSRETGHQQNRTMVLVQLVNMELARRKKRK